MNVLLASIWPQPSLGGLWTHIAELKQGLERRGHNVEMFAPCPNRHAYYLFKAQTEFSKQPLKELVKDIVGKTLDSGSVSTDKWILKQETDRYCFEMAASFINLEKYDVIHTHDVISARALSRVKPFSVPLVCTVHGSLTDELSLRKQKKKNQVIFPWITFPR